MSVYSVQQWSPTFCDQGPKFGFDQYVSMAGQLRRITSNVPSINLYVTHFLKKFEDLFFLVRVTKSWSRASTRYWRATKNKLASRVGFGIKKINPWQDYFCIICKFKYTKSVDLFGPGGDSYEPVEPPLVTGLVFLYSLLVVKLICSSIYPAIHCNY